MSIQVNNFMEVCVEEFLDDVLNNHPEICSCSQCKSDIAALALNELPPKYTTSSRGQLFTKVSILNSQIRTDIFSALAGAIDCVRNNPRHTEAPRDQ